MSNPNPPAGSPRRLRWVIAAGIVVLALYAAFLFRHTAVVAGGADSSGYLNSARLLREGRLRETLRAPAVLGPASALDAMHFLPQGFFPSAEREIGRAHV